ncbi:MAG: 4-hydroxy-tetrahydrodipicolinate reductase [Candidatus Melainabacteria bacterium]|nr:4-hydroxy-tetrahydrodipicolinate reductase [Candidatus Melainabacteria bacterium]
MAAQTHRVVVVGGTGKMGREVVKTVLQAPDMDLVGVCDRHHVGEDAALAIGLPTPAQVPIETDLNALLARVQADVCVEFTRPESVKANALCLVAHGVRPVIGTTGLTTEDLVTLQQALAQQGLAGAVIPNFAIGAVLLMQFAQKASQYFTHAEIVELHHNKKLDAPSGTALRTASLMAEASADGFAVTNVADTESIAGARGAQGPAGLRIHSVRLPGLVAHQEVLFGASGELFTLRHDSFDRQCFMPGVALACRRLMQEPAGQLVLGLEHWL